MKEDLKALDAGSSAQAQAWLSGALKVSEPFPWQLALLERMVAGALPSTIDVPTGLGKTAVIAIWLIARALGAPVPTRLVYVVDRRAVVDQATTVAEDLRQFVSETPSLIEALRLERPLAISTLRGQFTDNRAWLADPGAPAIVVGTVDMVGSRLLFEGYGVSRRMRPYHAGMLGIDTLLVLDEAHLVPPFEHLARAVGSLASAPLAAQNAAGRHIGGVKVLALSATSRAGGDILGLGSADRSHPIVARRLAAPKHLHVRAPTSPKDLAGQLALEARKVVGRSARRCIVFCNRRDDAQRVAEQLLDDARTAGEHIDVELLVGARRVNERRAAARWLTERGFMAGSAGRHERAAFVVATSAGEVGIDLDADHMVSDLVAWERMVQRLGRVNRRGEGVAEVVVVPVADEAQQADAPDNVSMVAVRELLETLPASGSGRDASPGALVAMRARAASEEEVRMRIQAASTPDPLYPELSTQVVDAWSLTSIDQHPGRPEVSPWLRGWIENDEPQTTIVWRECLPIDADGRLLGQAALDVYLDAAAPHLAERLEVESWRALEWLSDRAQRALDREAHVEHMDRTLGRHDACVVVLGDEARTFDLASLSRKLDAREKQHRVRLLGGAIVLVDVRFGGLSNGLLDAFSGDASDVTADVEAGVPFRIRREMARRTDEDEGVADREWRVEAQLVLRRSPEGDDIERLVIESRILDSAESEEGRSAGRAQLLSEHQAWTERCARALADRLGLSVEYTEMLAVAARLHDEGKRSVRWQRAFAAPEGGEAYGKTRGRPNLSLLGGYRHELGSVLRINGGNALDRVPEALRDLCLHLVAAHHGHARPLLRVEGADLPPSTLAREAADIALRFSRLQREWGPWGLAWWEALLRAADQQASRENDERDVRGSHG